jgi:hypothetical protein
MDYDYNSSRSLMVLPEYGRNIQKMVEYVKAIQDREERNRMAQAVINVMGNLNPHLRDVVDFKHKLWDHLAIISNFELDIDYPYDIPQREVLFEKPGRVPYAQANPRFRHYGKVLENFVKAAAEMPNGPEKDSYVQTIANHMKKSYLTWNKEIVNDDVILKDMFTLSGGKLQPRQEMKLHETRDILNKAKQQQQQQQRNHNPKKK